jgi:hypothetical protein
MKVEDGVVIGHLDRRASLYIAIPVDLEAEMAAAAKRGSRQRLGAVRRRWRGAGGVVGGGW